MNEAAQTGAILTLDGGDLFWKGGRIQPENLNTQRIKAELLAEDMMALGLDAWVPGEADWAIGVDWVLALVERHQLPVVAGNLVCGEQGFPGHRRIERDGRKIGVVGVVDTEVAGCSVLDPVDAARKAIADLGDVDVVIGVFQGSADLESLVLREVDGFDFFFNGHTAQRTVNPREVNGAWFLGAGSQGKHLGHLELSWEDNGEGAWVPTNSLEALEKRQARFEERADSARSALEQRGESEDSTTLQRRLEHYETQAEKLALELEEKRKQGSSSRSFRHQLVELDRAVADNPETQSRVTAALLRIESAADTQDASVVPLVDGPFLGSEACLGCHPAQAEQWKTTSHARAMQTLVDLNRSLDPDCYACHATGAHHPEGPTLPGQVGERLANVGCESCHGPGREHVQNPAGTMVASASLESCVTCHDGKQDGGRFDPATYIPKVLHPNLP